MRRVALTLVVALTAATLTACGLFGDDDEASPPPSTVTLQDARGPEDGLRVAVFGDSITALAADALAEELADTRLSITAVPGFRFGQFDLTGLDDQDPEVVVVALGTNNALRGGWEDDDVRELDGFLDDLGPRPCTLFVDVAVSELDDSDSFEGDIRAANDALTDRARQRSDAGSPSRIVEWSGRVEEDVVEKDRIHPTEHGVDVWADLVGDAVRNGC